MTNQIIIVPTANNTATVAAAINSSDIRPGS